MALASVIAEMSMMSMIIFGILILCTPNFIAAKTRSHSPFSAKLYNDPDLIYDLGTPKNHKHKEEPAEHHIHGNNLKDVSECLRDMDLDAKKYYKSKHCKKAGCWKYDKDECKKEICKHSKFSKRNKHNIKGDSVFNNMKRAGKFLKTKKKGSPKEEFYKSRENFVLDEMEIPCYGKGEGPLSLTEDEKNLERQGNSEYALNNIKSNKKAKGFIQTTKSKETNQAKAVEDFLRAFQEICENNISKKRLKEKTNLVDNMRSLLKMVLNILCLSTKNEDDYVPSEIHEITVKYATKSKKFVLTNELVSFPIPTLERNYKLYVAESKKKLNPDGQAIYNKMVFLPIIDMNGYKEMEDKEKTVGTIKSPGDQFMKTTVITIDISIPKNDCKIRIKISVRSEAEIAAKGEILAEMEHRTVMVGNQTEPPEIVIAIERKKKELFKSEEENDDRVNEAGISVESYRLAHNKEISSFRLLKLLLLFILLALVLWQVLQFLGIRVSQLHAFYFNTA